MDGGNLKLVRGSLDVSSTPRWYVIRTISRQEAAAEVNLLRQDIRVFIPKTVKSVRHARKIETRKISLFPGYGFVELDLGRQRWLSINGTIGVSGLIMAREVPVPVPLGVVEGLLDNADVEGIVDLSRGLAIGSDVRMRSGPFAGAIGMLADLDGKGRVEILLQILNGSIRLRATQDILEAI